MDLDNISICELLPQFMRRDGSCIGIADGVTDALRPLAGQIAKLSTFDALEMLDADELDALADELNVMWYDRALTLQQRRALLANSDRVYMRLGTRAAVVQAVRDVFGDATIQEYWEYDGGRPHYFRVTVQEAASLTAENEAKLIRLLGMVQRRSQWLHRIYAESVASVAARVGVGVVVYARQTVTISTMQDNPASVAAYAGVDLSTNAAETNNIIS